LGSFPWDIERAIPNREGRLSTLPLLQALLAGVPAEPIAVRRVLVGLHFTAVCSLGCGLSASLANERPHHSHPVTDAGNLHERSAQELAHLALSPNLTEASIGMAALNSLISVDLASCEEINAMEVLAQQAAGKRLAMVGHFSFVDRLRRLASHCWVIEQRPGPGDLPESAAKEILPQADVIAITATAVINHTIDQLLSLCPSHAAVMLLGPSAPLAPLLFERGVTILSGAHVIDEGAALQSIEQGAIFPQVNGVKLLTIRKNIDN
jgi:uncharacterized protein (DUF4213/DUF364 family)